MVFRTRSGLSGYKAKCKTLRHQGDKDAIRMKPSDIGKVYKKHKGSVFIEIPEAQLMDKLKNIK